MDERTGQRRKPARRREAARGGRPAKFAEPSTRVTVTLPDRTLARLAGVGADRAKAIVQAVDAAFGGAEPGGRGEPVRFLPFGPGEALIAIHDNRLLRALPWLSLVETAPGLFVIAIDGSVSSDAFEIALGDLLESPPPGATAEELDSVRRILANVREPRRRKALRTKSLLVVPADRA